MKNEKSDDFIHRIVNRGRYLQWNFVYYFIISGVSLAEKLVRNVSFVRISIFRWRMYNGASWNFFSKIISLQDYSFRVGTIISGSGNLDFFRVSVCERGRWCLSVYLFFCVYMCFWLSVWYFCVYVCVYLCFCTPVYSFVLLYTFY